MVALQIAAGALCARPVDAVIDGSSRRSGPSTSVAPAGFHHLPQHRWHGRPADLTRLQVAVSHIQVK
jgi:hypothetical protein